MMLHISIMDIYIPTTFQGLIYSSFSVMFVEEGENEQKSLS